MIYDTNYGNSATKFGNQLSNGIPTHALAADFQAVQANYDARKYPICAPHDGSRGLTFHRFANDFLSGIATIDIKDPNEPYDLSEHLIGIDENGDVAPPGDPDPIPPDNTPAGRKRRKRRTKLAYSYVYQHITDERLRKMLHDEAFNDGRAAWLVINRECDINITDLEIEDLKNAVRSLTIINTVGYNEHSVTMFRRTLNDVNTKIPDAAARIQEGELCLIMLRAVARATNLFATDCDIELKADVGQRKLVYPADHPTHPNERSLSAIVAHFDPLWKAAIQRGSIPIRTASAKTPGTGKVDAMVAYGDCEEDGCDLPPITDQRPGISLAYVAQALAAESPQLNEIVCWNCKGMGHAKSKCPSQRRNRSYGQVIALLTKLMGSSGASAVTTKRVIPLRRNGGGRPMRRTHQAHAKEVTAFLMSDGSFVLSNGEHAEWAATADAAEPADALLQLPDDLLAALDDDTPDAESATAEYAACNAATAIDLSDDGWIDVPTYTLSVVAQHDALATAATSDPPLITMLPPAPASAPTSAIRLRGSGANSKQQARAERMQDASSVCKAQSNALDPRMQRSQQHFGIPRTPGKISPSGGDAYGSMLRDPKFRQRVTQLKRAIEAEQPHDTAKETAAQPVDSLYRGANTNTTPKKPPEATRIAAAPIKRKPPDMFSCSKLNRSDVRRTKLDLGLADPNTIATVPLSAVQIEPLIEPLEPEKHYNFTLTAGLLAGPIWHWPRADHDRVTREYQVLPAKKRFMRTAQAEDADVSLEMLFGEPDADADA
jgi:hypothetical protein